MNIASRIVANTAETCRPPTTPIERRRSAELEPVAQERWSLRATVDRAFKDDLETLRSLLAHEVPDGDLTKVLHEAVRCAVEKHGKRRGAVPPARKTTRPAPMATATRAPSAAVQREVWEQDGVPPRDRMRRSDDPPPTIPGDSARSVNPRPQPARRRGGTDGRRARLRGLAAP